LLFVPTLVSFALLLRDKVAFSFRSLALSLFGTPTCVFRLLLDLRQLCIEGTTQFGHLTSTFIFYPTSFSFG
jgi:hypothetical protein